MFFEPKIKRCLTIDEHGVLEEHQTFKGFTDSQRLIDRNQCFEMIKGTNIHDKLLISWKNVSDFGIVIPKGGKNCT